MEGEWRNVPGFLNYRINIDTPEGKCLSLSYDRTGIAKLLSNRRNKKGRIVWTLFKNGKRKTMDAARWIALTFPELVENEYFEGAEIDHKDTNRTNNHPSNLRWATSKENSNNPLTRLHNTQAHKGRVFPEALRKKISESQKGKIISAETRKKQSITHINNPKQSKQVAQLTDDGSIVKVYPSTAQASRETGISTSGICRCCNGSPRYSSAGGYKWRYVE